MSTSSKPDLEDLSKSKGKDTSSQSFGSDSQTSGDLQEVDIEKTLKQKELAGEETESIVLSEKEDTDEEDDEKVDNEQDDDEEDSIGSKTSPSSPSSINDGEEQDNEGKELEEGENSQENPDNTESPKPTINIEEEELAVSSSDEDSDEEDESMRKLEQDINKDVLLAYHPETQQINFQEQT